MNLRTLFLAIPLLSSGITVHADTFDMSYSFTGTGDVLSGTFTGTANGNDITNISNASFSFDGMAIPGLVYIGSVQNNQFVDYGSQLSFNGLENNIWVSTANLATASIFNVGSNYSFGSFNDQSSIFQENLSFGYFLGYEAVTNGQLYSEVNSNNGYLPAFNPANIIIASAGIGSADVSSTVPVPAAMWLFAAALAGVGLFGKYRKAA